MAAEPAEVAGKEWSCRKEMRRASSGPRGSLPRIAGCRCPLCANPQSRFHSQGLEHAKRSTLEAMTTLRLRERWCHIEHEPAGAVECETRATADSQTAPKFFQARPKSYAMPPQRAAPEFATSSAPSAGSFLFFARGALGSL